MAATIRGVIMRANNAPVELPTTRRIFHTQLDPDRRVDNHTRSASATGHAGLGTDSSAGNIERKADERTSHSSRRRSAGVAP